jgi:helicase required for RNAi-mediated heterochromatin assembly 1
MSLPEIPDSSEIWTAGKGINGIGNHPNPPPNQIFGPFKSVGEYLYTHFSFLREDCLRPLRVAITAVKAATTENIDLTESNFGNGSIGVYDKVFVVGITFSTLGIATKVAFGLDCVQKKVHWNQSKRLLTGSIVALSPREDNFATECIIAVVAARPISGLAQKVPEIDLFFKAHEQPLNPTKEYLMIEERSTYYEANRHIMAALQHMASNEIEQIPLVHYLVDLERAVSPPKWLQKDPILNIEAVTDEPDGQQLQQTNVLNDFPKQLSTSLDPSQLKALQHLVTRELALVQGPPGTGKTHVSVIALQILLDNMIAGDSPIIVACQTNHALDQLLRKLGAAIENNFIRLGGRSKDEDFVKSRTLHKVRKAEKGHYPALNKATGYIAALKSMKVSEQLMVALLQPIREGEGIFSHEVLRHLDIITHEQYNQLEQGDDGWIIAASDDDILKECTPMEKWLDKWIKPVIRPGPQSDLNDMFDFEEAELEVEEIQELESENVVKDDDFMETLKGGLLLIADNYTGVIKQDLSDDEIRKLLQKNMWDIPKRARGAVYCYLQRMAKQRIEEQFRVHAEKYNNQANMRRIAAWDRDLFTMKSQKIIGVTTTGLSKYRGFINALSPRIVLIEEAAETLEAPVIAALYHSLEQLILVGDHQQLRPQTQARIFENNPFNFNLSLFERLVNNQIQYCALREQRRMIPEIRRLLLPIYGKHLRDHLDSLDANLRPSVPGMGGVNSYFLTHSFPEDRDENMSYFNLKEANMVANFFLYLCHNGVSADSITVLTFYHGQRKKIVAALRRLLPTTATKVVTVDSFQGEENDIILLSLVRSNQNESIGFLQVKNRVCVALSRAKCGFYLFGNAECLVCESKIWSDIVKILSGQYWELPYGVNDKTNISEMPEIPPRRRIGFFLPLWCIKHGRKTFVDDPSTLSRLAGGCEQKCNATMDCGHPCLSKCHP